MIKQCSFICQSKAKKGLRCTAVTMATKIDYCVAHYYKVYHKGGIKKNEQQQPAPVYIRV